MALLLECPALDFCLGHGPRVVGSSPALSTEFAWDSLALTLSLSLSYKPPLDMCKIVGPPWCPGPVKGSD